MEERQVDPQVEFQAELVKMWQVGCTEVNCGEHVVGSHTAAVEVAQEQSLQRVITVKGTISNTRY